MNHIMNSNYFFNIMVSKKNIPNMGGMINFFLFLKYWLKNERNNINLFLKKLSENLFFSLFNFMYL